jgi:serine/threonine protein kinase
MPRTKAESGYASIFISYSHGDAVWMERFRKELQAALFDRAKVWCDKDIERGARWEERLAQEIGGADVALILASTQYLRSKWCRRELESLCDKLEQEPEAALTPERARGSRARRGERRLQRVFWVELSACAWKQTELADFQRSGDTALNEITDELARDREIVRIVEEICAAGSRLAQQQPTELLTVKALLGDAAFKRGISIDSVISNEGEFTIVCRGRDASRRDVAIKVMRRSPITGILENLDKAAERRRGLTDPGFIRLHEHFMVRNPYGDHLVLVMEHFDGSSLREALNDKSLRDRFGTDGVVRLIRRAAEALKQLHDMEYGRAGKRGEIPELGFGPMIPDHLFYDARLDRVRFAAVSISNYAWDVLGWRKFATLISNNSERYAAPEQFAVERATLRVDKRKVDQYMLGQLAVEMLDGKLPIGGTPAKGDDLDRKKQTLAEPLKYAGGWKETHPQLERIVAKMLASDPQARWSDMGQIAAELRDVESDRRALAKSSFVKWIDGDAEFFAEFYAHFFRRMQQKGIRSTDKFRGIDEQEQNEKLRRGMAAVLNFRPGNEPTSLRYVARGHRKLGVSEAELVQFKDSFLELLEKRLGRWIERGNPMLRRKAEILDAWRDLFEQVVDYFRKEGLAEMPAPEVPPDATRTKRRARAKHARR